MAGGRAPRVVAVRGHPPPGAAAAAPVGRLPKAAPSWPAAPAPDRATGLAAAAAMGGCEERVERVGGRGKGV